MTPLCDHIREDAYECMQQARWLVRTRDGDYHACHNHVWQFFSRDEANIVYAAGARSV